MASAMSSSLGFCFCGEKGRSSHDHARLAIAALRHLLRDPCGAEFFAVRAESFNRRDFRFADIGERERTTPDRLTV